MTDSHDSKGQAEGASSPGAGSMRQPPNEEDMAWAEAAVHAMTQLARLRSENRAMRLTLRSITAQTSAKVKHKKLLEWCIAEAGRALNMVDSADPRVIPRTDCFGEPLAPGEEECPACRRAAEWNARQTSRSRVRMLATLDPVEAAHQIIELRAEVEHLRHAMHDALKFLDDKGTGAAILKAALSLDASPSTSSVSSKDTGGAER